MDITVDVHNKFHYAKRSTQYTIYLISWSMVRLNKLFRIMIRLNMLRYILCKILYLTVKGKNSSELLSDFLLHSLLIMITLGEDDCLSSHRPPHLWTDPISKTATTIRRASSPKPHLLSYLSENPFRWSTTSIRNSSSVRLLHLSRLLPFINLRPTMYHPKLLIYQVLIFTTIAVK